MQYKRIILKLSGESLMDKNQNIHPEKLAHYVAQIKEVQETGVEVGLVLGGGNIFRGIKGMADGVNRVKGDYMGMLATVINSLAVQSALEKAGTGATVFTAINMQPVAEMYSQQKAIETLSAKRVAIFSFGTGNPFFTTDTAAALRAVETQADAILKGTRVDGVYSADPEKDTSATMYSEVTFNEAYAKNLKIMDLTAFTMCKDNNIPVVVFNINKPGLLKKIISGEDVGTLIKN
jgi:uridylate kinase